MAKLLHGFSVTARNPVSGDLLARYRILTAEKAGRAEEELWARFPGATVRVAVASWSDTRPDWIREV